jgi:fibronectin-binding autotransporter adhesin
MSGRTGKATGLDVFSSPTTTLPTGTVTINTSARLVLTPLEGVSYQNGWSYTIMTAENGITGNFSATAANRRVIGDFATFNVANTGNALVATISGAGLGYPVQNIVADVSPGGQGTILQETTDPANQQVYFRSGSVYHVDIGENGQSDRITVAGSGGTVTIEDGAKVVVSPLSGIVYAPGWTYTILAANAIEGQFDDPTANGDFASLSLIHGPRSVTLRIDSVPRVDFASMAETDNQRAVAGALNTVAQGTTLYNTMFLIEAGGTPDALDQLSGVVHASTKGALILHNLRARDAIGARLGTAFGLVESGTSPVMSYAPLLEDIFSDFSGSAGWEATNAPVAWASAYGGWGELQGEIATYDTTNHGVLFGIDSDFWGGLRVGGVLGYGAVSLGGATESASAQSYLLGLYGGGQWNDFSLQTGILYGFQNIETQRSVSIASITGSTFTDALSADYMGDTLQVFGEMSYSVDAGVAAVEPFVGFSTIITRNAPFTETGGAAALTVSDEFIDATFAMFGVRASSEFDLGGIGATVNGSIGWRQGLGTAPRILASFAGSEAFAVSDTATPEGVLLAGAGVDLQLNPDAVVGVSWNGQFGSRVSENSVLAKVGFTF